MPRRFAGLRHRPPHARYDAIVVGAGIGGLVNAALLADAGLRTLLVEQHYMVGGYCSTFRRAGFTFDASTHFYRCSQPRDHHRASARPPGRRDALDQDGPGRHLPPSRRDVVRRAGGSHRVLAAVKARFPAEAGALDAFFADVRQAYVLGLQTYFRGQPGARFAEFEGLTVRAALDRHFHDPRLKLLLTADCPHWGSPPERTSFVFDSMLRLSYFLGNYYPAGGSQSFADELARAFEVRGGDILMSSCVERIRVADGRVRGIEVETLRGPLRGHYAIDADVVVSNADLVRTLECLLGDAASTPEAVRMELAAARRLRPSFPCFLTHIGLRDVPHADLVRAQGYYWRDWNPDTVGRDGLICKIFAPTVYDAELAPPGGAIVILQKVLEMDPATLTDWPAHKRAIESQVFDHLCRVLPGIEDHVVVRLSASAATAERYTLNLAGAMLGWEMAPDQLGPARPAIRSPIDGLYFTGHWTRPGGGVTPVMVSAMQAADEVLGRRALERRAGAG